MDAEHALLAQRLDDFHFDRDPGLPDFTARLARENAWSREYTARVTQEYKRFVRLAVTDSETVSPSDAVDQAWHLHLTYSRQYWDQFCVGVLGRPLHHHPSAGDAAARRRCIADYERTLMLYREVFGEPPPSDIWPASKLRFGRDLCWARVNVADGLILPRHEVVAVSRGMTLVLGALALYQLWSGAMGASFLVTAALALGAAWVAYRCDAAQGDSTLREPPQPERERGATPDAATPDLGLLLTLSAATTGLSTASDDAGGVVANAAAGDTGAHGGGGGDGGGADGEGCGGGGCGGCGGGCGGD
jgi:hypothetical protein